MEYNVFVRVQDVLKKFGVVGVVIPQWKQLEIVWVSRDLFSIPLDGLEPGMVFEGNANLNATRQDELELCNLTRASAPDPAYSPAYALWEARCRELKSISMSGLE